jgi:hypothetical protein
MRLRYMEHSIQLPGLVFVSKIVEVKITITLASEIDVVVVNVKGINKLLVEANQFKTKLNLVGNIGYT